MLELPVRSLSVSITFWQPHLTDFSSVTHARHTETRGRERLMLNINVMGIYYTMHHMHAWRVRGDIFYSRYCRWCWRRPARPADPEVLSVRRFPVARVVRVSCRRVVPLGRVRPWCHGRRESLWVGGAFRASWWIYVACHTIFRTIIMYQSTLYNSPGSYGGGGFGGGYGMPVSSLPKPDP